MLVSIERELPPGSHAFVCVERRTLADPVALLALLSDLASSRQFLRYAPDEAAYSPARPGDRIRCETGEVYTFDGLSWGDASPSPGPRRQLSLF